MVAHAKGRYTCAQPVLHLGTDSPLLARHHANWRVRAIESLDQDSFRDDLHYSSAVTVSREDALKIKSLLVKAIEQARAVIHPSKEEELYSFCLDFFEVRGA